MLLNISISIVNFNFGCMLFKNVGKFWMSLVLPWYKTKMSSTYIDKIFIISEILVLISYYVLFSIIFRNIFVVMLYSGHPMTDPTFLLQYALLICSSVSGHEKFARNNHCLVFFLNIMCTGNFIIIIEKGKTQKEREHSLMVEEPK